MKEVTLRDPNASSTEEVRTQRRPTPLRPLVDTSLPRLSFFIRVIPARTLLKQHPDNLLVTFRRGVVESREALSVGDEGRDPLQEVRDDIGVGVDGGLVHGVLWRGRQKSLEDRTRLGVGERRTSPSASSRSTTAPPSSTRNLTISKCPFEAARRSGVVRVWGFKGSFESAK